MVGEEWKTAFTLTREWRCVTVGQRGCRWLEQTGGVNLNLLESGDVLQLDKEDRGGWSRVQKWI